MKKIKIVAIIALLCLSNSFKSQDTLKVMYYNLLNFPGTSDTRADTLKKIVQYVLPDIFAVNELKSAFGGTQILSLALNQNGITHYQQATFVNGPDTDNLLFYNSTKLGLLSQNEIPTALRDINEYVLYYKAPDLSTTQDTTYFYVYSLHLKALDTDPNPAKRLAEAQVLKDYLGSHSGLKNVLVGGDFNFYSNTVSEEPAFDEILNGGIKPLNDPINMIGDWHNNSAYVNIHTQSTRSTDFNGGPGGVTAPTGGMDDRFDFIFISNDLLHGWNKAKYIDNSYKAIGQDGAHFNSSLADPISNGVVPDDIANALYEMSDHLPVYLEIEVGGDVSITENDFVNNFIFNSTSRELEVFLNSDVENASLTVYDLTGKKVLQEMHENTNHIQTSFPLLNSGIYIVNLQVKGMRTSVKVVVL